MKAAGLVDTLSGPGPVHRVRADQRAFAKLPAGTVETLLKPENKATLTKILTYHVVPGDAMSATIVKMRSPTTRAASRIKTLGGCTLQAKMTGKITLTDEKRQHRHRDHRDVKQSNGVIHVIDKVMLPKKK